MPCRTSILFWLFASLLPSQAMAQFGGTIDAVAGPLASSLGGLGFGGIAEAIARSIAPLVTAAALFIIVLAGIKLVISQEEDQLSKARKTIIAAGAAIVIVNIAGPLRSIVFAPGGAASGGIIATEIAGIVSWLEVPAAVVAVLMIIISGLRAVISYGSDEGVTQMRQAVISILFGLVVLSVKVAVSGSVVGGSPAGILGSILVVVNIILGFTALVATAVIIIAGFYMIVNVGNDENYTYARSLILRVGIGLIVILISLALANLVIFAT